MWISWIKTGSQDPEESIDLSLDSPATEYEGNTYMGTVLGDQIRFDFRGGTLCKRSGGYTAVSDSNSAV